MVMALMVVALTIVMRSSILAALNGNWMPLAQFLLLVQAIASFDIRTRGGLYAGIGLSGIVLFLVSQQAFDLSFGVFLLGYAGMLMAFLAVAYLQDEAVPSQPKSETNSFAFAKLWTGIGGAVLLLAVAVFLVLPRGEDNAVGYQSVAALPITGESSPDQIQSVALDTNPGLVGSGPGDILLGFDPSDGGVGSLEGFLGPSSGESSTASTSVELLGSSSIRGPDTFEDGTDVVMYVRSPVASYWRGQVFDTFDGSSWQLEKGHSLVKDGRLPVGKPIKYLQTFYINQAHPGAVFMGYRGVEVSSFSDALYNSNQDDGYSYRVVSVQPDIVPEQLRQDRPGRVNVEYVNLPSSLTWLQDLADQITAGATTSFDQAQDIVAFVRGNSNYDSTAVDQLDSSTSVEGFLLEGDAGTSMDYATATVLLARAAGLPARLAVGYLPGERDLLSGAYTVRKQDAHAWAEVLFEDHGPVPFDGTPRTDTFTSGRFGESQVPGLKHLFESNVGDDLLRAMMLTPPKLSSGLQNAFNGPAAAAMAALAAGAFILALAWLAVRALRNGHGREHKGASYSRLPGDGRQEMLKIHRQVEKLLKKKGIEPRRPGQTLQEHAQQASQHIAGIEGHLDWLTRAAWRAAYDPSLEPFSPSNPLGQEASKRLAALKAALAVS